VNARCPRCQTVFSVGGPGRYTCPGCGVTNEVRDAPHDGGAPPGPPGGIMTPPPPPPPDPPSSKMACPECEFEFIVGAIAVATCPMCNAEVQTGNAPDDGDAP